MIRGMKHLLYKERQRDLSLLILEKRRHWGNLIATFWYLKTAYKKEGFFTRQSSETANGKGFKLEESRFE